MTGFKVAYTAPERPHPRRRPRVRDEEHLKAIRQLSCISCGTKPVQAAHIRAACLRAGKRETGIGEKPDDRWTLPLCEHCHLTGRGAQHQVGEEAFYRRLDIDPFSVAAFLWNAGCDVDLMEKIILATRNLRPEP